MYHFVDPLSVRTSIQYVPTLWSRMRTPMREIIRHINRSMTDTCDHGNLPHAQWIFRHSVINNTQLFASFIGACMHGHLHVAQWIHKIIPNISNKCAFHVACVYGHLHVAQWIHGLASSIELERTFHSDYIHRLTNAVQRKYETTIYADTLRDVCTNGHLHVAQWFYEIASDIEFKDALRHASRTGQLHVVQWIYKIIPDIDLTDAFLQAYKSSKIHVVKWIIETDNKYERLLL